MRKVVAAAVGVGVWGLSLPALAQEAPKVSWQARFERQRPSIVRAVEGVPGPAGYERETHYDRRRMIGGSVLLGLGTGLQLALVSSRGFAASELVPCAGVLSGDYGQRSSGASDVMDSQALGRALLLVPICAAFFGGAIELGRGLLDPRPVWVKGEARAGSVRVGALVTGKEARVHALGYF